MIPFHDNHDNHDNKCNNAPTAPTAPTAPDSQLSTLNSQLQMPSGSLITPGSAALREKQERVALRRAQLCEELDSLLKREKISLSRGVADYLELYNNTAQHSIIYATLGAVSPSTLRRWYTTWKKSRDWRDLVPQWKSGRVGHEVPHDDFYWIIGVLHDDAKPPVSSAIRWWHLKLRNEGRPQPVSDRTMQRAISVFAQRHAPRWAYMRRGAKYFREHYLPSILQDGSNVKVGDLWYSDGCTLNINVLNPYTGRPARPTLVPFMDYASKMVICFDLDFSENRRVIASSYRNGICLWGFVPLYVKWDNGRAFRSLQGEKMTRAERELLRQLERDEIAEIAGNIYATGVLEILNSLPYNPTGKASLERWFGTLDSGLERYLPGYRGNSIPNKPAHLQRNEKHLQAICEKRKGNELLTITEAKILLEWWIIEVYGMEPHPGLNGRTPWEVWNEGIRQIDPSRRRNPDDLYYLMLSEEVKKLDRGGVKVRGLWYYDEALFDYVGRKVFVRYDQMDDRYVFVYDELRQPICRALLRPEHDPLVTVRGSADAKLQFVHEMKIRGRLEKRIKKDSELLQEITSDGGTFLQEAVHKVREMKAHAQLTNTSHAIPEIPATGAAPEPKPEPEPEDKPNEPVLPPDYLDALGMGDS